MKRVIIEPTTDGRGYIVKRMNGNFARETEIATTADEAMKSAARLLPRQRKADPVRER